MRESVEVLLVATCPPGHRGSMARFAHLVELALKVPEGGKSQTTVRRLDLGFPWPLAHWVPSSIQTWLNHLWLIVFAKWRISRSNADLVHLLDGSYAYLLKNSNRPPAIATVHDLIPLIQEDGRFGLGEASFFARKIIREALLGLETCVQLLADSASTAHDLTTRGICGREDVTVVPISLDPLFATLSVSGEEQLNHQGLASIEQRGPDYILHVGNNGFYKNREGVLRIYARVQQNFPVRLVMVGPVPTDSLKNLASDLSLEDRVDFVVEPDDPELVELYRNAALLLFPSLYEGFGWPPLEAMACGCPVVCSSAGALPEIAGGAALMAPAQNEEELARHCLAVLTDPELASVMIEKGREWSSQFNVERMRKELELAYHAAISKVRNVRVAAE